MRNLFLFILLTVISQTTFAQHVCGTHPPTQAQYEYTRDVISQISVVKNAGTTCVPIRPHVVRNTDGTGGISFVQLNKGLAQLNQYYYDAGIEFYWCGETPDYIDDDALTTFTSEAPMVAAATEATDAFNMYFIPSVPGLNGYAYFPANALYSTRIIMRNGATGTGTANTMVHELGHTFSLYHTHQGTENGPASANAENVPRPPAAGANCATSGDLICDTDADPRYYNAGFNFGTCTYTDDSMDILGNIYTPNIDNFMNYFPDQCQTPPVLTPGQFVRIAQGFATRQAHTAYSMDCPAANVANASGLTATYTTSGIVLNWVDNANNDMGYLIERSLSPTSGFRANENMGTDISATTFTDNSALLPGTTYYYRVKASNDNCNDYSNVASVLVTYCAAGSNNCDENVSSVAFGTINNVTNTPMDDCVDGVGYNDYTAISTSIAAGSTTPITVTTTPSYTGDQCVVWIDWNQNYSFDDAGESYTLTYNAGTFTGNVVAPVTAFSGNTVMRIRVAYTGAMPSCGITTYGEVEDYTINVTGGSNDCEITNIQAGFPGDCIPATNEYTADVTISYMNPASTGNLSVNGQLFGITTSPQTVTLTGLVSNGMPLDIIAAFTDSSSCTLSETAAFTAPENCEPCSIDNITVGSQTACVVATNQFTQDITVTYSNAPNAGTMNVNGQAFAILGSPQTVTLTGLSSDGSTNDVVVSFSADAGCTLTLSNAFTAPASCYVCNATSIDCGVTISANTNTSVNVNNIYNCVSWNETGPELIYTITTDVTGDIVAALSNLSADLDVFILDGCLEDDCIEYGNTTATAIAQPPGTYYIIVDGYNGVSGTFDLLVTANCASPTCDITNITAGTQTACVPASNTYTQDVEVTFSNAPATGTLDVNGQSFAIGTSPQTVTLTGLTADGNDVDVTASFSADGMCATSATALFTAPVDCTPPPPCNISMITAGSQTACVPASNTYTQDLEVTFSNAPASGTLDVNGQSFAIGTSPQTVTLTGLTADGNDVDVTASFSADGMCATSATALFTAPADCTPPPPCNISMITAGSQTACDPNNSTYNQDITITFSNPPSTGTLEVYGQFFVIGASPQTVTLMSLNASGNDVDIYATFSAEPACTLTETALYTAPADCTPPPCNISMIAAGTQTACVPTSNTYTQDLEVTYSNAPASGTLDVNGQSFAIGTSPQTVTLTGLTADGNDVDVTASFSADAACTTSATALFTAPADCTPPPPCNISMITAGTQTACVPTSNTYTQDLEVTYSNAPASGTLDVNGQSFAIGTSPQTVTLTGLSADGNDVDVTASFSADAACTTSATALFTAPADCFTPSSIPNDVICGAIEMPNVPQAGTFNTYAFFGNLMCNTISANNTGAAIVGEPNSDCGGTGGASLWYTFTTPNCAITSIMPFNLSISTSNSGTTMNTKVDVFSSSDNTCSGTLTSVACNDDNSLDVGCTGNAASGASTLIEGSLAANTTYFVRVDGSNGETGNFELSLSMMLDTPDVVINTTTNLLDVSVPESGAYLYTYYWRPLGYSGYSIKNTPSNTYTPNAIPGNTYQIQVMNRCSPSRFYRTPVETVVVPAVEACEPSTSLACDIVTDNSILVSWDESTGMYQQGSLSGYVIYFNEVGTAGYSVISNPSPSCVNGSCSYYINNLAPGKSYEIYVSTRCTPTKLVASNTVVCTTSGGGMMRGNGPQVFSFESKGVEYVDVNLMQDWANFGLEMPKTGTSYVDVSTGTARLLDKKGGTPLIIDNTIAYRFSLVPNPARNETKIVIEGAIEKGSYAVYNVQGKLVASGAINAKEIGLPASDYHAGMYFVQLNAHGISSTQKLVILE